jgi:hypothetical protein
MVGRALSDRVKHQKSMAAKRAKMERAVAAYLLELQKEPQDRKGYRVIADLYGVDKMTLQRRVHGKQSIEEFNKQKQKLTEAEEEVLVNFILGSADRGFPLVHQQIESFANAILQKRNGPGYQPVGQSWVYALIDRHHDKLQSHWSKPLDMQRAQSLNPAAVNHWFDLVEEVVVKTGISKENIYGMDESGFPPSDQGKQRVVGARGTKTQHKVGGADRENVTALVTICANGTSLCPTITFKGKNMMSKWTENNVSEASYVVDFLFDLS